MGLVFYFFLNILDIKFKFKVNCVTFELSFNNYNLVVIFEYVSESVKHYLKTC